MSDKPNSANGVSSYDSTSSGSLIHFFNRNVTPYATESSGPKFDLVPVEKHKDIMLNVARLHAKQEYDRIMELVQVLQRLKPSAAKGTYFRSIYMSSTMSPSVSIDIKSIPGL